MTHDASPKIRMVRKAALASAVGTVLEAYDFQIFGVASALVFDKVFFSNLPSSLGVVFSFATLGVGFLARPVGGVIFGHLGDRFGRKKLLVASLMGAGACTTLTGLLPTNAQVGVWAPVILVALRLLQGGFHGGEQGGAMLMAVEHAPEGKRGWYGSWALTGSAGGTILSAGTMAIVLAATGKNFLVWGWRIPFVVSLVILGVGLVIRLTVTESPAFEVLKQHHGRSRMPISDVLKHSWRLVLVSIGVNLGFNAFAWLLVSYSLAYGTGILKIDKNFMLQATQVGAVFWIVAMLFFAWLSDRVGRMKVLLGGALFLVLYPFPMFGLFNTAQPPLVMVALIVGFVGTSAVFGPLAAFLVELFPTRTAYSGVSLGYGLGAVLGGGLTPFVASLLMEVSGGQSWTVSLYLAVGGAITLVSLLFLRFMQAGQRSDTLNGDIDSAQFLNRDNLPLP